MRTKRRQEQGPAGSGCACRSYCTHHAPAHKPPPDSSCCALSISIYTEQVWMHKVDEQEQGACAQVLRTHNSPTPRLRTPLHLLSWREMTHHGRCIYMQCGGCACGLHRRRCMDGSQQGLSPPFSAVRDGHTTESNNSPYAFALWLFCGQGALVSTSRRIQLNTTTYTRTTLSLFLSEKKSYVGSECLIRS